MYETVTDRSDAEFELLVRSAKEAFLAGDAKKASPYVHFPLTVHLRHRTLIIRNASQLQEHWSRIFTASHCEIEAGYPT